MRKYPTPDEQIAAELERLDRALDQLAAERLARESYESDEAGSDRACLAALAKKEGR